MGDIMTDSNISKLAKLITDYSTKVKEDDIVMIKGNVISKPLMLELYEEVVKRGAHPYMVPMFTEQNYLFFSNANEKQLDTTLPFLEDIMKSIDVSISIDTETNLKQLSNIDPEKISRKSKSNSNLMEIFMNRQATGDLRWVVAPYPSESLAQEACMSLEEYENFVYGACLLDKKDPVAEWKALSATQKKVCDYLGKKHTLHIIGKDTDLTLDISGRKWINCDGDNNMPDGEVFTGPVEDSAEGTIRYTYPAIYMGNEIEDVKLTFKNGKVIDAKASKGEPLLKKMIATDDGSSFIGEAAIGTNYGITQFTKNILFDEKIGGSIHIALGAGYPDSGSKNASAIHWDMLKDMKEDGKIYADDELFYEQGRFLI